MEIFVFVDYIQTKRKTMLKKLKERNNNSNNNKCVNKSKGH